jgi:hypothetical protein
VPPGGRRGVRSSSSAYGAMRSCSSRSVMGSTRTVLRPRRSRARRQSASSCSTAEPTRNCRLSRARLNPSRSCSYIAFQAKTGCESRRMPRPPVQSDGREEPVALGNGPISGASRSATFQARSTHCSVAWMPRGRSWPSRTGAMMEARGPSPSVRAVIEVRNRRPHSDSGYGGGAMRVTRRPACFSTQPAIAGARRARLLRVGSAAS